MTQQPRRPSAPVSSRFPTHRSRPRLEQLEGREVPAISLSGTATWQSLGPTVINSGQNTGITGNPVIGAVNAIATSPLSADIIFTGGSNTGVWRTNNGTAASPTWTPLTDNLGSMSVSDISFDPADTTRVIVGIGNTSDGGYRNQTYRDANGDVRPIPASNMRGDLIGVLFSTNALDANPTWQVLTAMAGQNVRKVHVRNSFMLVSTDTGVYRSTNQGATFTKVLDGVVFDLAADPGPDADDRLRFYAATKVGSSTPQVWRTDNGGAGWGQVDDVLQFGGGQMRINPTTVNIKISVFNQTSVNDVVYVAIVNDKPPPSDTRVIDLNNLTNLPYTESFSARQAQLTSVVWSTNQGGNWTRMDTPRYLGGVSPIFRIATDGTITMPPGVRHRLKVGDQVVITGADDNVTDTTPLNSKANNNWVDPNTGAIITPPVWFVVSTPSETEFTISDTLGGAVFATGKADPFVNPPGAPGAFQQVMGLNAGERGEFIDIVADPTNANLVYIAGNPEQRFFGGNTAAVTYDANTFRGDRTINPSALSTTGHYIANQWVPLDGSAGAKTSIPTTNNLGGTAAWYDYPSKIQGKLSGTGWVTNAPTTNGSSPAGDAREMVVDKNGQLLFGTGGGLYRQTAPTGGAGTWVSVNGDLSVGQVWSVGWDQLNSRAFGGFQDTFAGEQSATGSGTYSSFLAGAGYNGMFDQANSYTVQVDNSGLTGAQTVRYYVGTNFSNVFRRVFNAAGTLVSSTALTFSGPGTPTTAQSGLVATDRNASWLGENIPISMQLNANDPRRAMYGTTEVYEDSDPIGATGNIVNRVTPIGMTGRVASIGYGGKRDGLTFNQIGFVGTSTGQLWRRGEFGVSWVNLGLPGTGTVEDIAVDPDDWRHAFAVRGNEVYETLNADAASPTWTNIGAGLVGPAGANGLPAGGLTTDINAIALYDANPGSTLGGVTLAAGGRGGVFRLNTDPTCGLLGWTEYGSGLPNTVVSDLNFYGDRLVVGTFGRGIWSIPDVRATLGVGATLIVTGDGSGNTMTLTQDPADANRVIVTDGLGNTASFAVGEFGRIQFNGLGGADTLIVGSNGLAADSTLQFIKYYVEANMGGDANDQILINGAGATAGTRATFQTGAVGYNPGFDTLFGDCGYLVHTGLNLGTLQVTTGSGNDQFLQLAGTYPQRVNMIGGAGNDSYTFSAGGTNGRFLIADSGGADAALVQGSDNVDTIFVSSGAVETGTFQALFDTALDSLTVNGLGGADTLVKYGSAGNDAVVVRQTGLDAGTLFGLPSPQLTYTAVEDLQYNGAGGTDNLAWEDRTNLTFGSPTNPDAGAVYKPLNGNSGEFRVGNPAFNVPLTTLRFTGVSGSFLVNGDPDNSGDRDVLTVLGISTTGQQSGRLETTATDGQDSVFVTDAAISISNVSLGQTLPLNVGTSSATQMSYTNIFVRTGNEATAVGDSVYARPTLRTNIIIDGGNPVQPFNGNIVGDSLLVEVNGARTITNSTDPLAHQRITQVVNKASVGYLNFETVSTKDVGTGGGGGGGGTSPVGSTLFAAGTEAGVGGQLRVYNSKTGAMLFGGPIFPFGGFSGGVRVATGDVNGDGVQDVVAAAGPGGGPQVNVYDGTNGVKLYSFFAFESAFRGGVNVTVGDVNGDGFGDVIAAASRGGGPRVRVISGLDRSVLHDFFAFEPTFTGGVTLGAADFTNDGLADLVVGAESGTDRVRVLRMPDRAVLTEFNAYGGFNGGVSVAAGDLTGDGVADVITGAGPGGAPHVKAFSGVGFGQVRSFFVSDTTTPGTTPIPLTGGVRVAAMDQDGDGLTDILTGLGKGSRPLAQIYQVSQRSGGVVNSVLNPLLAVNTFGNSYGGGIFVG